MKNDKNGVSYICRTITINTTQIHDYIDKISWIMIDIHHKHPSNEIYWNYLMYYAWYEW